MVPHRHRPLRCTARPQRDFSSTPYLLPYKDLKEAVVSLRRSGCNTLISMPLVIASLFTPVLKELFQLRPISSNGAASGLGPTSLASPASWVFPNVWLSKVSAAV